MHVGGCVALGFSPKSPDSCDRRQESMRPAAAADCAAPANAARCDCAHAAAAQFPTPISPRTSPTCRHERDTHCEQQRSPAARARAGDGAPRRHLRCCASPCARSIKWGASIGLLPPNAAAARTPRELSPLRLSAPAMTAPRGRPLETGRPVLAAVTHRAPLWLLPIALHAAVRARALAARGWAMQACPQRAARSRRRSRSTSRRWLRYKLLLARFDPLTQRLSLLIRPARATRLDKGRPETTSGQRDSCDSSSRFSSYPTA